MRRSEAKQMNQTADNSEVATVEFAAALEFEPWTAGPDDWSPPSNEEWANEVVETHLVTIRLAYFTMLRTKAEMVQAANDLDNDTFQELLDCYAYTAGWLEGLKSLVEGARARVISATAAAALGFAVPADEPKH